MITCNYTYYLVKFLKNVEGADNMEVSEVRVLARRANGILLATPVPMVFTGLLFFYSFLVAVRVIVPDKEVLLAVYMGAASIFRGRRWHSSQRWVKQNFELAWCEQFGGECDYTSTEVVTRIIDRYNEMLCFCVIVYGVLFLLFLISFVERLLTPKIMIEYDDYGLYIYQRGKVTLLKYKELWSTYSTKDVESINLCYHRGLWGLFSMLASEFIWSFVKTGSIRIETPDGFIVLHGVYHVRDVEFEIKKMIREHRKRFIEELEKSVEEERMHKLQQRLDT